MLQEVTCNPLYIHLLQIILITYEGRFYICHENEQASMDVFFDAADFYKSNYEKAVHYAQKYIFNVDEACDVVSDSFVRLLELSDRLDPKQNIRALFYSIIHNKCMDSLRRLQCYTRMELRLKQRADGFADDEFEAMCQKELFRIIGKAISEMPRLQQRVFCEIRMNGMNYKEVADMEGIKKRKVEYQLKLATEKLRKHVEYMYG